MVRPKSSLGVVLSLGLVASTARGESPNEFMLGMIGYENRGYGEPLVPGGIGLDRSSVGYETIRQAANTNAQTYGAIGAFDRHLRPTFDSYMTQDDEENGDDDEEGRAVVAFDHHQTYGVGRAIGLCERGSGIEPVCDGIPRAYTADLYSLSYSLGWGDSKTGYFLSGSYSLSAIPPLEGNQDQTVSRGLFPLYIGLAAVGGLPFLRLLGKDAFNKVMPGSADGIVGGYATVGPVRGYAGFVLSRGLFGDVSIPSYNSFVTAALAQEFSSLALVKAGLRDLLLDESVGRTSLFAQRIVLPAPRVDPAASTLDELSKDLTQVQVITAHVRQMNIGDYVDLKVAVGAVPKAFLHEAAVGVHSKDVGERRGIVFRSYQEAAFGWSASVGTTALPPLYYYAVEGGNRLFFKAEMVYGALALFVRMNDPDFLTAFPYAHDAFNAGLTFGLSE